MLEEVLGEIQSPPDICSVTDGIAIPSMPDICLDVQPKEQADIFKVEQRKSWDKSEEARCDFSYKLRLTRRASTNFITIWQKSVFGRTYGAQNEAYNVERAQKNTESRLFTKSYEV